VAKSTMIAIICTFFDCFNIPVFWPILVMYFITLFCITMKRQIKVGRTSSYSWTVCMVVYLVCDCCKCLLHLQKLKFARLQWWWSCYNLKSQVQMFICAITQFTSILMLVPYCFKSCTGNDFATYHYHHHHHHHHSFIHSFSSVGLCY
jgi:hypothetical protein